MSAMSTTMNTLPDLLERLLTDRQFRADFTAGSAELPAAFDAIVARAMPH